MGVPKFFRWLSERYPAISQLIAENRIPEFDCLYLDMNGIIHNCTHKDSDSPTFRMTEDKMFIAIFNYIEHLFGKIKPRELFFMAIDGVAPRAKMNQQRSRRFRTALDAEVAREKAIKSGAEMPKEDPFDSNCITPGTDFMARLTQQLKYFINKKVSEDVDWQGVEVVLSGHEVPGEGEHKIMEYIRQAKSQPNYDPNRRHCLYGLDADLIMLGLLSHDPHFCLLREEVAFGRQSQKKSKELEHQNFYLLHLCLVREYLELEFQELAQPEFLSFPFDMERVIDDLILMAFFVGNDFLPNLPHLHINEGALALMFGAYKKILSDAGGYINENGVIQLERLKLLLDELSHVEYRFFEAENADAAWFKGKRMEREDVMDRVGNRGLVMSTDQKKLYRMIKEYVIEWRWRPTISRPLNLPSTLPASDRKFVENMAEALNLCWRTVLNDAGERHMQVSFRDVDGSDDEGDEDSDESEIDEESIIAIDRVLRKYENAKIVDISAGDAKAAMEQKYEQKFIEWKNKYYSTKLGWDLENEEELREMTENYVQGLQWVLYYYYRGVASWPWFYRYHYSPMISDVKCGLKANMNFTLGQPFRPYQQLMGVLPDRSKKIVPSVYHDLMCQPDSPIIDFYPKEFELDMNGKKMEWEAVVKIPFIDEKRLLKAMAPRDLLLTEVEKSRNEFGVSLKFTYSPTVDFTYQSSLQGIFPDIPHCHCVENIFELPTMDGLEVFVGLMKGVQLGAEALAGFPSLKTLDFTGTLGFHGVNVFQQDSRNESMVVTLSETDNLRIASNAKVKVGKVVHVGYPFLQEARIVKVTDELFDYVPSRDGTTQTEQVPHTQQQISFWRRTAERVERNYSKRLGIIIDDVEALVQVEMLKGLKKTEDGATIKEYGEVPGLEHEYAAQTIVDEVFSEDQRFLEKAATPFHEDFPVGSRAFFLGDFNYGRPLEVISHNGKTADVWVSITPAKEREFGLDIVRKAARETPYTPSYAVSRMLNLNPLVLSKLTSSFFVNSSSLKLNLGLNLKFEGKKLKVLGYSRRAESGWEYSQKAIDLIQQYMIEFPEFIAGIMKNPKGDVYEDIDFYPNTVAKEKMKEMGNWLKSVETKSFQKVPLDAEQLDSDIVMEIQNAADENLRTSPVAQPRKVKGVPRSALLRPSDAEQRLGIQRFSLGDRVLYVQDSGRVPIAQRGTVVGLTRTSRITYLDVVFDTSFMSGTTLDDRCSPFRGSTVPVTSVLNITDKQRIAMSKAASEQRQQSGVNAENQPNRKLFSGGNPNEGLTPAGAPPALRGSFRNALSTRANGGRSITLPVGRGRGISHHDSRQGLPYTTRGNHRSRRGRAEPNATSIAPRGSRGSSASSTSNVNGYVVVDLKDPTEGVIRNNPNFRPQSYRSVPPPASLNTGGRGRGSVPGRGQKSSDARGTSR